MLLLVQGEGNQTQLKRLCDSRRGRILQHFYRVGRSCATKWIDLKCRHENILEHRKFPVPSRQCPQWDCRLCLVDLFFLYWINLFWVLHTDKCTVGSMSFLTLEFTCSVESSIGTFFVKNHSSMIWLLQKMENITDMHYAWHVD